MEETLGEALMARLQAADLVDPNEEQPE